MRNALLALMVLGSFGAFAEDKHEGTQLSNPILVDVRTDAEWNDGYIETAIHIPLDSILKKIESINKQIFNLKNKLKNKAYVKNAPKEIVQNDKKLTKELTIEEEKLRSIVTSIN